MGLWQGLSWMMYTQGTSTAPRVQHLLTTVITLSAFCHPLKAGGKSSCAKWNPELVTSTAHVQVEVETMA